MHYFRGYLKSYLLHLVRDETLEYYLTSQYSAAQYSAAQYSIV